MKKQVHLFLLPILALTVPQIVWPGFEEGLAAYRNGDHKRALIEYQKAVEAGDERAFGRLGAMYLYGLGTEKDYLKAYVWFALASETGDTNANRFRDAAASQLTAAQLHQAESLISEYAERLEKRQSQ